MNHTRADAPKCKKKFNFLRLCSYFIVSLNSNRNHIIMNNRRRIINQPGHVWYSSISFTMSISTCGRGKINETIEIIGKPGGGLGVPEFTWDEFLVSLQWGKKFSSESYTR